MFVITGIQIYVTTKSQYAVCIVYFVLSQCFVYICSVPLLNTLIVSCRNGVLGEEIMWYLRLYDLSILTLCADFLRELSSRSCEFDRDSKEEGLDIRHKLQL